MNDSREQIKRALDYLYRIERRSLKNIAKETGLDHQRLVAYWNAHPVPRKRDLEILIAHYPDLKPILENIPRGTEHQERMRENIRMVYDLIMHWEG